MKQSTARTTAPPCRKLSIAAAISLHFHLVNAEVFQGDRGENAVHVLPMQLRAEVEPAEAHVHEAFAGLLGEQPRELCRARAGAGEY